MSRYSGMSFARAPLLSSLLFAFSYAEAYPSTWATLPMNVSSYLVELESPSTVPVLFGTPPQLLDVTVDVATGGLAAYSSDCILCAGSTMFDSGLSSTYKTNNTYWDASTPSFSGVEASDTVGFAGLLSADNQPFENILDGSNFTWASTVWNGYFGLFLDPLNSTATAAHIFSQLHESSSLLNPVVGMRFDPGNPKITIGALDPNDYEGTINWVQLEQSPDPQSDYFNIFNFDGVKGYDGQFVPYNGSLNAAIDSDEISIVIPNAGTYFNNTGSTGPIPMPVGLVSEFGLFEYNCSSDPATQAIPPGPPQSIFVAFTVTINGVDYQIDSANNLIRPMDGAASPGYCPVGIKERNSTYQPSAVLGLPFLRSVYVAYRFPTDDCPGYYGFAFPSGSNRTQEQISQKPTATPTNSAQCLALTAPTSTPTASVVLAQDALVSKSTYAVFGDQEESQVSLMGVDDIPKMVWNWSAVTSG